MLSTHEPTWDKTLRRHTCCGSIHSYHKSNCPTRKAMIPGRSSDPDFIAVQTMKNANPDMSSFEVARFLNLPLDQVNDLWIQ